MRTLRLMAVLLLDMLMLIFLISILLVVGGIFYLNVIRQGSFFGGVSLAFVVILLLMLIAKVFKNTNKTLIK